MDGSDVVRDVEELRPRVAPLLEDGELLQGVIRASDRPAKAIKLAAMQVWPFFREHDRHLLVATDRRWLVLQSAKEGFAGELHERVSLPRDIRVEASWVSRFDGFDQPYAIDPLYELWVRVANDALDAAADRRPWDLETAAAGLTAEDDDETTERLADVVMKVGRFVPRRRRAG